ncbi:MFS transporter [Photobacterium lucens]|uniref:MFS transporter n=1 Tax=Photobacterium lucens TaxID=2562949 RepID=UPI001369E8C5|nr:MFS transporter [Photobacterium lucens]MBP2699538.1 MFS transporter [Vibrio parahaemolyticus]MZG55572.1 MFS transporter [Photobacterium lucens]MZG82539.1 MFS transporter [Photobacterium lucens]
MNAWRHHLFSRSPISMLIIIGIASVIANTGWRVVMNNFAVDTVGMTGANIGVLQSIREIPGLLSFTVMFLLMLMSEQRVAILSLCVLGIGVAITGYLPSIYGFYFTTVLMSIGFHYLEAVNRSLSTQVLETESFGQSMGMIREASSFIGLATFIAIILAIQFFDASAKTIFFFCGLTCAALAVYLLSFAHFKEHKIEQKNNIILRKEYSVYYLLTFLGGARRQIFVAFAGLLMVQKFHYSITMMAVLFMISSLATTLTVASIGRFIDRIGEKRALMIEYLALAVVFTSYAFVDNHYLAGGLYILDSILFSFTIALATYFKKTIRSDEIASSSSVSFTINHIAAVFLPFLLGLLWVSNYQIVFFCGAVISCMSLMVAFTIKSEPLKGKTIKQV